MMRLPCFCIRASLFQDDETLQEGEKSKKSELYLNIEIFEACLGSDKVILRLYNRVRVKFIHDALGLF